MKDHFKQVSLAVPVLLLAFSTLAVVPAFALSGRSPDSGRATETPEVTSSVRSTDDNTTTELNDSTSIKTVSNDATEVEVETETRTTSGRRSDDGQTAELRSRGKALVDELQKEHKSKLTDAQRPKVCEAHKQGLTNKFTVIARNSQSYQTRIDDIYAKALTFQTSKNVSSVDLTALIATADAAKDTSDSSVANLLELKPTLDCNNLSVASDVATFKTAAGQTRTDLKAYKAAVKAVLQNLKSVTKTSDDTTTPTTTTEKSN